jgi:3-phenylpropionate/trans-cinnamate dioxygenase ferredoxin subunit
MPIKITIRKNGPLFIHPDEVDQVTLVDHEGNVVERPGKSITLCRCGASSTKPFCDGTHSKIGFQAGEKAREEFDAQRQERDAQP